MSAMPSRSDRKASGSGRAVTRDGREALLAPLPGPDFEGLDWGQSVIGWWVGLAIGTLIAAAVIVVLATGLVV